MRIRKTNGKLQKFNKLKIESAILKAAERVEADMPDFMIKRIALLVEGDLLENEKKTFTTDEISKLVENRLMNTKYKDVARSYIEKRHDKDLIKNTTDDDILSLISGDNEEWNTENANKNATVVTTQRDYFAGILSKDIAKRYIIPKDVQDVVNEGAVYVHDLDYIAEHTRNNCGLLNLEDMLQNGTIMQGLKINKPKRLLTATTLATQTVHAASASQYGGLSVSLAHLAPFVHDSRKIYKDKYKSLDKDVAERFVKQDVAREIKDSVQTFNYQLNSISAGNGQTPFITLWMYLGEVTDKRTRDDLALLIEEFLRQRIEGMENEYGAKITVAFPKLVLCLDKHLMSEDYADLRRLAAECTSKRLVPDYVSEKIMKQEKINKFGNGDVFPPMGCRSFLTPDVITVGNIANAGNYNENEGKYYGRCNGGVCSLNLALIAMKSANTKEFYRLLNHYAEKAHKMQKIRIDRLSKTKANVAPILWQHGAYARLNAEDTLDRLVHNGYMTMSIGYVGLYECTKALTGKNFWEDEETEQLAKDILQHLNDLCLKWREEENVHYSLYGVPGETLNGKFGKACKREFGDDVFIELDGHDRDYITNSCHIPVFAEIDAFDKLEKESALQKLSPGGNIIYIETPDMTKNLEAVEQVLEYIYDNCMYAELNTETSYCAKCGSYNTVKLLGERDNYKATCTHCGCDDERVTHAKRVCGYIGTYSNSSARSQDIHDRVKHLDDKEV